MDNKLWPLIILEEAELEITGALAWYGNINPDLEQRFLSVLLLSIASIRTRPESYPVISHDVRVKTMDIFPYRLFYRIEDDLSLTLLACYHDSREPDGWQGR